MFVESAGFAQPPILQGFGGKSGHGQSPSGIALIRLHAMTTLNTRRRIASSRWHNPGAWLHATEYHLRNLTIPEGAVQLTGFESISLLPWSSVLSCGLCSLQAHLVRFRHTTWLQICIAFCDVTHFESEAKRTRASCTLFFTTATHDVQLVPGTS